MATPVSCNYNHVKWRLPVDLVIDYRTIVIFFFLAKKKKWKRRSYVIVFWLKTKDLYCGVTILTQFYKRETVKCSTHKKWICTLYELAKKKKEGRLDKVPHVNIMQLLGLASCFREHKSQLNAISISYKK